MTDTKIIRLVPGRPVELEDGTTLTLQTTETSDGRYLRGADIEVRIERDQ